MPEINYNTNYTIINLPIAIFSMLFHRFPVRFFCFRQIIRMFKFSIRNDVNQNEQSVRFLRRLAAVRSTLENACSSKLITISKGAERKECDRSNER